MKIKKIHFILAGLSLLITTSITQAQEFTDVQNNSPYKTAIEYLEKEGIIKGYQDNTFQPDKKVNRVEFLKLVLKSSNIKTDTQAPTNFTDIDETAWYAKYVRKAKKEQWIEGYSDGTFKPENPINKVEALKIIGEVQKWKIQTTNNKPYNDIDPKAWFTPYISYAKNKNFLEERTSNYFPEILLSRAQISELLFRSYITKKANTDKYSISLIKTTEASAPPTTTELPQEKANTDFTPITYKTYNTDFFNQITLTEKFPNTFYNNELYFFEGTIDTNSYSSAFIFLAPEESTNNDYLNYVSEIKENKFKIPVFFRKPGNYKMGLILGDEGESKIVNISVLNNLPNQPSNTNTNNPTDLDIQYKNGETTISWKNTNTTNQLTKLTVSQPNVSKTFYLRQNKNSFSIDFTDFIDFKEKETTLKIQSTTIKNRTPLKLSSKWSNSSSKKFTAAVHNYRAIKQEDITINDLKEIEINKNPIIFTGTTKTRIFTEAAIIKPNGFVDLTNLTSTKPFGKYYDADTIEKDQQFTFKYNPQSNGTYIVELNGTNGSAVFNVPIYINNGTPIIPDYFDINKYIEPEPNFNLAQKQNEMLELINQARQKANLQNVTLNTNLNTLAQKYSDKMAEEDFFGHIDTDNKTPDDRRLEINIAMPVGENLAISPTILYTHKGLMQSGIHRKNILDPKWTKVGIGISTAKNGSIITTEEFSSDTYTLTDLKNIKTEIFEAINTVRVDSKQTPFSYETKVQIAAEEWSKKMAEENFFDFTSPNQETLESVVQKQITEKPVQAILLESVSIEKLKDEVKKDTEIKNNKWKNIGIGIQNDSTGSLKTTILLTTY